MCYLNYQKNNNLQPKLNKNILVSLDKEKIMIKEIWYTNNQVWVDAGRQSNRKDHFSTDLGLLGPNLGHSFFF